MILRVCGRYGIIDWHKELKMKGELGSGNFGVVKKAILRRRGPKPARYCAVKELERGHSLAEETALQAADAARMRAEMIREAYPDRNLWLC